MDRALERTKILSNHLLQSDPDQLISAHTCVSYTPPEMAERVNFDVKEMRELLDGHNLKDRDWLFNLLMQSKLFNPKKRGERLFVTPDYNQTKEQQREITMKRIAYLLDRGVFNGWLTEQGSQIELTKFALQEVLAIFDHSLAIKVGVHFFLW